MNIIKRSIDWLNAKERSLEVAGIWTQDELRREETRGVFVLGILAIIVTFRDSIFPKLNVPVDQAGFPEYFLLTLLVTWSVYAFGIVVALSQDIFPKVVCVGARWLSRRSLFLIPAGYVVFYLESRMPSEVKPGFVIVMLGGLIILIWLLRDTAITARRNNPFNARHQRPE